MIVGLLSKVSAEKNVLPAALVRAIEALMKLGPSRIEAGRYEVEGDKLFVLITDHPPTEITSIQCPVSSSLARQITKAVDFTKKSAAFASHPTR